MPPRANIPGRGTCLAWPSSIGLWTHPRSRNIMHSGQTSGRNSSRLNQAWPRCIVLTRATGSGRMISPANRHRLLIPERYDVLRKRVLELDPIGMSDLDDIAVNILGFMPFGFIVYRYRRLAKPDGRVWNIVVGGLRRRNDQSGHRTDPGLAAQPHLVNQRSLHQHAGDIPGRPCRGKVANQDYSRRKHYRNRAGLNCCICTCDKCLARGKNAYPDLASTG